MSVPFQEVLTNMSILIEVQMILMDTERYHLSASGLVGLNELVVVDYRTVDAMRPLPTLEPMP